MTQLSEIIRIRALSRRDFMRLTSASMFVAGTHATAARSLVTQTAHAALPTSRLYENLLRDWCDGLIAHQMNNMYPPALAGAFVCPACGLLHGRCADAVHPLLRVAHMTGDPKYVRAAELVYNWSELQVSRPDGSWINDVTLSPWQGITVFRVVALGEALRHHGEVLDEAMRRSWTERIARAAAFLDGFIAIDTGNINYPIASSYALALSAVLLGEHRYMDKARALAHQALEYISPQGLIFGEGHPQTARTAKGCRAVDLGYNVEESLPALALYSVLSGDGAVRARVVESLRAHLEFMLPNGAWDNSWGTRNFKWTWWGSRTSDGCHPAFAALADEDPRFIEAARRNMQLMAQCTHESLLYGGPDLAAHGDYACIHHTFTHAKSLATALDLAASRLDPPAQAQLPRDLPYGVRSFPEIHTHLVSVGPWRATVTDYDFEYIETVQGGGSRGGGGGHATGGALSMLYHQQLGAVTVASMTHYQALEITNQQPVRGNDSKTLTPRIECALQGMESLTSLNDLQVAVELQRKDGIVQLRAQGQLMTTAHHVPTNSSLHYKLLYEVSENWVEIEAGVEVEEFNGKALRYLLPVAASHEDQVEVHALGEVWIHRKGGMLKISTDARKGFAVEAKVRIFNLVPGILCAELAVDLEADKDVKIRIEAAPTAV